MDLTELNEFGKRYAKAWCSQDPESVAAFYAEDGSLKVNDSAPAVGRRAIADVARGFMNAFPDMKVIMDDLVRESRGTAFHWTLTGTNTGLEGTGKRVRISGHELWQLDDDGLIANSIGHFDSAEYERQLKYGVDGLGIGTLGTICNFASMEYQMLTQAEKGKIFRELHERNHAFIIPNPWDVGTARLLAHVGFEALATTSAGYAFSVGQRDNTIDRDRMMSHVAEIVSATDLPVSADLENGFGDSPETVAETIRLAASIGLAGCSIEDMKSDHSIYELELAIERIRAAAEIVRKLPFAFTLTGRAENYLVGRPDLKDTIQRLQAYQEAGANVLYAPGLKSKEDIVSVVRSVDRPVNVVMGLQGVHLSLKQLSEIGVKRVSVGSALSRAALGAFLRAAREMKMHGTFTFAEEAVSYKEISDMFNA